MEERRKNKRLDLEGKLLMKRLDDSVSKNEVNIDINNVSRTGIGFNCSEKLEIGAVYECKLTLWTKDVIGAFMEIVRIEKNAADYTYGAMFIGMPDSDLARISVYETVEAYKGN